MSECDTQLLAVPGFAEPLRLSLPADIRGLRDACLAAHARPWGQLPELGIADATAWADRPDEEPWLLWRARRFAARLASVPIGIRAGECIVGTLAFHQPTADDEARLAEAREVMAAVPAFPGGDSGHFHPDYEKIFRVGVNGLLDEIDRRRGAANEPSAFYDACRIAMEGFGTYLHRVADACDAATGDDADLATMAAMCRALRRRGPRTFHEACQLMHLVVVASWVEDHGLSNYGRMDQTLGPFYEADVAAGRTTPQRALELISMMYIQLNRLVRPALALAVIVGGPTADARDATNDLTYICLAARQATQLCYPTVGLAWHEQTPDALMDFAVDMLSTGIGDPALFNDPVISRGLRSHGVSVPDSHNFMNSTCVEIKTVGNANIWVACRYFNLPAALLEVMAAEADGTMEPAEDIEELSRRIRAVLTREISGTAARLSEIWAARAETGGFPFASCLIADCLERGVDFDDGGCRYNWAEVSFVGLANLADAMIAVAELVYQRRELTLAEFYRICEADFADHEPLRQQIVNRLPKYGNDDDAADALAAEWARFLMDTTEAHTAGVHRLVPGFFCWVMHGQLGGETIATPDGRRAGTPLADGAGPAQGRDTAGPTASVRATTTWPHEQALGGLAHNLKFTPALLATGAGRRGVRHVIETYLRRGGFEVQINVVSAEPLRAAQADPESHRDLIVRVAGYSDYFTNLTANLQDEVIRRTEFAGI